MSRGIISYTMNFNTIQAIAYAVAHHYKIKVSDLFEDTRKRSVSDKRSVFFFFAYKYSGRTLTEIGEFAIAYGRRVPYNHATVIHSYKKITELKEFDRTIADDVQTLENYIVMNILTEKQRLADSFYKRQEIIRDLYQEQDMEYVDLVYQLLKVLNTDKNKDRLVKSIEHYKTLYHEGIHKTA